MFKTAIAPFFWAVVTLSLLGDLGQTQTAQFKVKFRRCGQAEYQALMARVLARMQRAEDPSEAEAEADKPIDDQELIDKYLLDWADLVGDDDHPLAFTPDNLAAVLDIFGARAAIVTAFFDAYTKAPAKNSEGPLATP